MSSRTRDLIAEIVPYTFEESLALWADDLEIDADSGCKTVRLTAAQARMVAEHLRGALRLIEQERAR